MHTKSARGGPESFPESPEADGLGYDPRSGMNRCSWAVLGGVTSDEPGRNGSAPLPDLAKGRTRHDPRTGKLIVSPVRAPSSPAANEHASAIHWHREWVNASVTSGVSMLYQFLFILTSTRQPTSVVLATDTALFSLAVLAHSTNPRDTSPQARFQQVTCFVFVASDTRR